LVAKGLANKSMRARSTFSEAMLKTACGTPDAVQGDRPISPPHQAPLQEKIALEKGPPTVLPPVSRADTLVVVEGAAPISPTLPVAKDVVYKQTPLGITCRSKATGEPPKLTGDGAVDAAVGTEMFQQMGIDVDSEAPFEPAPPVDPDADGDDDFIDPLRPVNVEPAIHGTHGIGAMQPQLPNQSLPADPSPCRDPGESDADFAGRLRFFAGQGDPKDTPHKIPADFGRPGAEEGEQGIYETDSQYISRMEGPVYPSPPPLSDEEIVFRTNAQADALEAAHITASEFWKMPAESCQPAPDSPEAELARALPIQLTPALDEPSEDDLAVGKALGLVLPAQPAPLPWEKDAQKPPAE
jgi:hypothetical protein